MFEKFKNKILLNIKICYNNFKRIFKKIFYLNREMFLTEKLKLWHFWN